MRFTEALEMMMNDNNTIFKTKYSHSIRMVDGTVFVCNCTNKPLKPFNLSKYVLEYDWEIVGEPPKPKYKFWEVVKMLTEDNGRKFKRSNTEREYIADLDRGVCLTNYVLDDEWEEVL